MSLAERNEAPERGNGEGPATKRRPNWWRRAIIVVAALVLAFYGGGGWYFASKIQRDALELDPPGPPDYEVEVLGFDGDAIRLSLASGADDLTEEGIRGVSWPGGYGQVGAIESLLDDEVVRAYRPIDGTPAVGEMLDIEGRAFPGDPLAAHGLAFETISYQSDLGPMPAWYVPGDSDAWVILVHGKGAPMNDTLRVFPVLADAGYHILSIAYRNDPIAPEDPSGEYGYGATEWRDVEGAVAYAVEHGAGRVALFGYSMGGGIIASFMSSSSSAGVVDGIVFDAPMLDFSRTVDLGAANTSLPLVGLPVPQSLTNVAKLLAGWRFDIDWGALDYMDEVAGLDIPMLVLHGDDDETVPIETSRELAEKAAGDVRLEEFADTGHIESWNTDPDRYEGLVREFLTGVLG